MRLVAVNPQESSLIIVVPGQVDLWLLFVFMCVLGVDWGQNLVSVADLFLFL